MALESHYKKPDLSLWQGRKDTPPNAALFQITKFLNLTTLDTNQTNSFALLGFCSDEGVRRNRGRVGAAKGPDILRSVLAKIPIHKALCFYDAGNIVCVDNNLESAQIALGQAVSLLLKHHITPIVIGGGHEVAYGHFLGIKKQYLDIVNFDAHLDMRPLLENNQGSSGTPFLQIAQLCKQQKRDFNYHCIGVQKIGNTRQLLDTAVTHNVNIVFADDIHTQVQHSFLTPIIATAKNIYVTTCLDVFASPYAPGVSAPQPYGLTPAQIIPSLRQLAASGKVLTYDIAELAPAFDQDNITAKLATQLIFEIIHNHSFKEDHHDSSNTDTKEKQHTCP